MDDPRIEWIKERALTFLGESDMAIFNDMLLRERNAKDRLTLFLEGDLSQASSENRTMVFFKSYVDAIIEEEVLVPEIVKKSVQSSASASESRKEDISSKDENGDENGDEGKDRSKGKSKGKGKSRSKSGKSSKSGKGSAEADESGQTGVSSPGELESSPDIYGEGEKDAEDEEDDEGKKKKKKKKGKGESKRKKSGRISPETLIETVPEPEPDPEPPSETEPGKEPQPESEPEVIMVLKKIERVIQKPLLHVFFGYIPEEDEIEFRKMKFIFFVRSYDIVIPPAENLKEAWKIMPQFIRVGTVESDYMSYIYKTLEILFGPLLENVYCEPTNIQDGRNIEVKVDKENMIQNNVTITPVRKPSHYMNLVLDITKEVERETFLKMKLSVVEEPIEVKKTEYDYLSFDDSENDTLKGKDEEELEECVSKDVSETVPMLDSIKIETKYYIKREDIHKLQLLEHVHEIIHAIKWIIDRKRQPEIFILPCVETFHDDISIDIINSAKDPDVVKQFEVDVMALESTMKTVLNSVCIKTLTGREPLDECQFWKSQYEILHQIVEELKLIQVNVDSTLQVLERAKSEVPENYILQSQCFMKHYNKALDNHTYLQTVERHFEIITNFPNFHKVQKAIEFTMTKLYFIWNLSGYYCNDDTMVPLMERIAFVLVKNVKKYLNLDTLFSLPVEEIQYNLQGCIDVLETWRRSYYDTRKMIENRGNGQRWEFDKNKLFRESEWIKTICSDLLMTANVLADFSNIFGRELKSVLKDPTQIDSVMYRVYALLDSIKQAEFDIFDWNNHLNWETTIESFKTEVKNMELQVDFFISSSFELLRDTELSLEVLLKLIQIQTRPAIHEQLKKKFMYIIECYKKELTNVEMDFKKLQAYPPVYKNHPPYSGSICWANDLYMSLRKPMLAFQTFPKSCEKDLKQNVYQDFLQAAIVFKKYMDSKYAQWLEKAIPIIKKGLSKSVLTCVRSQEIKYDEQLKHDVDTKDTEKKVLKSWEKAAIQRLLKTSSSVYKMKKLGIMRSPSTESTESSVPVWKRPPTPVNLSHHTQVPKQPKSLLAGMSMRVALLATKFKRKLSQPPRLSQSPAYDSLSDDKDRKYQDVDLELDAYEVMGWGEPSAKLTKFQNMFFTWIVSDKPDPRISWTSFIGDKVILEYDLRFAMNFSDDLIDTLDEAIIIEELGYTLPEFVYDIAVQKNGIILAREKISKLVATYNELLEYLTKAELFFVKDHLMKVEKKLYRGLIRITWANLGIHHFISSCQEDLTTLSNLVKQLHKISGELQGRVRMLASFNLFYGKGPGKGYFRISIKGFFSQLLKYRNEEFCKIMATYKTITPTLIKLESLILQTSTGHAPQMTHFYAVWEIEAYNALLKLCIINLKRFLSFLHSKTAYFRVDSVLSLPDITLDPTPVEIYNIMIYCCRDFMKRFQYFKRWLSTTCIECPLLLNKVTGDEYHFTFFEEIMKIPQVGELLAEIQQRVKHVVTKVSGTVARWRRYRNLWIFDKVQITNDFAKKNPPLKTYDEIFFYYENIIEESKKIDLYIDINCVRINCIPVTEAILKHANEWKQEYGYCLANTARRKMNEFVLHLEDLKKKLEQPADDLRGFKAVLQTIADVRNNALQTEFRLQNIRDSFHTLELHNVPSHPNELKMANELPQKWTNLYKAALVRSNKLEASKPKFVSIAQAEINSFFTACEQYIEKFQNEGPPSVGEDLNRGLILMQEFVPIYNDINKKRLDLVCAEMLFDLPVTDYEAFLKVGEEIEGLEILYELYTSQRDARGMWGETLWANLEPHLLNEVIDNYLSELKRLPQHIQELSTGVALEQNMKNFKTTIPLMVELKNECLRKRHWVELMYKTGHEFNLEPDKFTLENIFSMNLHCHMKFVKEIIMQATKELVIERAVEEIENTWSSVKFVLTPHIVEGLEKGIIFESMDEILQKLENDSIHLQRMAESMYVGPFLETILPLEKNLVHICDVISNWLSVQNKVLCLEPFFCNKEICDLIPKEAEEFKLIYSSFNVIMKDTAAKRIVRLCCRVAGRLNKLEALNIELDTCQKYLKEYIDSKRIVFPRFYFLSDQELIFILERNAPVLVQDHIYKMFNNISHFDFNISDKQEYNVCAMISCEGESLKFRKLCSAEGYIENWMSATVAEMQKTHQLILKEAIYMYGTNKKLRTNWLQEFPGMIAVTANQVWWTAEIENVFMELRQGNKSALWQYQRQLSNQMDEVMLYIRSEHDTIDFKKFNNMVLADVYWRDIVEDFLKNGINEALEFHWECQLRFYWIRDLDTLQIKQSNRTFEYGYEYSGHGERLVITPLTDRMFLTFTQALSMHLGCVVAGPSGTGKTETVKDLSKTMAILFIDTNCSEYIFPKAMARILSGLVQSGAWGCFDEFDRIDMSIMSVISTQIRTIQHSLSLNNDVFVFESKETILDRKVGIFITINPGYLGRVELPESLKTLFRTAVCVVPDTVMICEITLFSYGFLQAESIAKKIFALYKLAPDILAQPHHYSFGLRSLKYVLLKACNLKLSMADVEEEMLVVSIIKDLNLPKLDKHDESLFLSLIDDIFLGKNLIRPLQDSDARLVEAIKQSIIETNFIINSEQINKIIQVNEIMKTCSSTFVIGPTGGGKSVIIDIVVRIQSILGISTNIHFLNPKVCSVDELYGTMDPLTFEWKDGVLTSIFRNINKRIFNTEMNYLVFDGDIDPLWIENMNSVMDDNKLLTLVSGERITLQPHCSLLFEVGDLLYASPSTMTRAGMIYVDQNKTGYILIWEKWILMREVDEQKIFCYLFEKYVAESIEFILKLDNSLKSTLLQTPLTMMKQLCFMLDALHPLCEGEEDQKLKNVKEEHNSEINSTGIQYGCSRSASKQASSDIVSEEFKDEIPLKEHFPLIEQFEAQFLIALHYSVCNLLNEGGLILFDEHLKNLSGIPMVKDSLDEKATLSQIPTAMPTLTDYWVDLEEGVWKAWEWMVPSYTHDPTLHSNEILVPTVDTERISWLLHLVEKVKHPVLFVGLNCSAKTAIINCFLQQLSLDDYVVHKINLSSYSLAKDMQQSIRKATEKRTKNIYGPPRGKKLICFIDDLHVPEADKFGTRQPHAFLRLLFERGGFYELEQSHYWNELKDIGYLAAMSIPLIGPIFINSRVISKFIVFNVSHPSDNSLKNIFSAILEGKLKSLHFAPDIVNIALNIVEATCNLYKVTVTKFRPTPEKYHYIFCLRNISWIIAGLCMAQPEYFPKPIDIVRLWQNEFRHVFMDRLICNEDINLMKSEMSEIMEKIFPQWLSSGMREPLLFGDFRNFLRNHSNRPYEDLLDYDAVHAIVQEILEDYNKSQPKINLILFDEILEHFIRVHRVLRLHKGHLLLVGVQGSSKETITKLAAHTAGHRMFTSQFTYSYETSDLIEDMKVLYHQLGLQNINSVFYIPIIQDGHESCLQWIDCVLRVGFIPTMFSEEEKEKITDSMEFVTEEENKPQNKDVKWRSFLEKCSRNLHIVMSMSPTMKCLFHCCQKFTSIVNNSTIDWMSPWTEEAFTAVTNFYMAENSYIPENLRSSIVQHMIYVHQSAIKYSKEFLKVLRRRVFFTPKHFLDYVEKYIRLLEENSESINCKSRKIMTGLEKIEETQAQINELTDNLNVQKETIEQKTKLCEKMMSKIKIATDDVTKKTENVEKKFNDIEGKRHSLKSEHEEIEMILKEALPALESARSALSELERSDIIEIRSTPSPAEPLQIVCECVAILRGTKDANWKVAKAMMADSNFLRTLQELNCETITMTQIRAVRAHMKKTQKLDQLQLISKGGYSLLKFVEAVLGYCNIYREVKPKKEKIQVLEREKEQMENDLVNLEEDVKKAKSELMKLACKYNNSLKERKILQEEAGHMLQHLNSANDIVSVLDPENKRWTDELEELKNEKSCLIGNCLLASAFLCYASPFTWEFRQKMIYQDWMEDLVAHTLPLSQTFKIERLLSDEIEEIRWSSEGLPCDEFTLQNIILTLQSSHTSMCIDPQQQAINWIKKKEEENNLRVLSFNDEDFVDQLKAAVKIGQPVAVDDINEDIDPVLNRILDKKIKEKNGSFFIDIGRSEIEYSTSFRLYLITKLSNPNLNSTIFCKTTVINFSLTRMGLEDELLNFVVQQEIPELQAKRKAALGEKASHQSLLLNMEERLLENLSISTTDILDKNLLLNMVKDTKRNITEINHKLLQSAKIIKKLNHRRNIFNSLVKHGSTLYLALLNISALNYMYEFSLTSFMKIFAFSLLKYNHSTDEKSRLKQVMESNAKSVYEYACIGISEKHWLLLSFQLAIRLEMVKKSISQEQLNFFILGKDFQKTLDLEEPPASWITVDSWKSILILTKHFPSFSSLINEVKENSNEWERWSETEYPESVHCPARFRKKLTPFENLLLLRCFRTDRLYHAIIKYVSKTIGPYFVSPPTISLQKIHQHSTPDNPVLFILNGGSDPIDGLLKHSEHSGFQTQLECISLEEGQERIALSMLKHAMYKGQWLLLQNCHMDIALVRKLKNVIKKLGIPHPHFRLWLTTSQINDFPVSFLQCSMKVFIESPKNLKLNLRNTFVDLTPEVLDSCQHKAFKPLLYVLSFFHGVLLERQKYGKIGWNICYDFNEFDYYACLDSLEMYLTKALELNDLHIPWKSIKFHVGQVIYGGKVMDSNDKRLIMTYMDEYMGDFLFEEFNTFCFYKDKYVEYLLPSENTLENFIEYIDKLLWINSPKVLGLHPNAELSYNTDRIEEIWTCLLNSQLCTGEDPREQPPVESVSNIVKQILENIPDNCDLPDIEENVHDNKYPLVIIQMHEFKRFNDLLDHMRTTIENLLCAMEGKTTLNTALQSMYDSFQNGEVPETWLKLTPETSERLGSWILHFGKCAEHYKRWAKNSDLHVIWLPGLYAPESYLTALMQVASRTYNLSLDEITLYITVSPSKTAEEVIQDENDCVKFFEGLYLEAAHWNSESCSLETSKSRINIEEFPPLVARATQRPQKLKLSGLLCTPVYKTPMRQDISQQSLVCEAYLPTSEHNSTWTLQGVCLFLRVN